MARVPKWVKSKPVEFQNLYGEYIQLAKQADQRLVRLEKLKESNAVYKNVDKFAYNYAKSAIEYFTGESAAPRFNRGAPRDIRQLKKKISNIKHFIDLPTSTKGQIDKSYKSKVDKLNEQFNTDFTWEELHDFFTRSEGKAIMKEYGSGKALKVVGHVMDNMITQKNLEESLHHLRTEGVPDVELRNLKKFVLEHGREAQHMRTARNKTKRKLKS